MNIQGINKKDGKIHLRVDHNEDCWYLQQIIQEGDRVKGRTERKISVGSEGAQKKVRKKMTLEIGVEKIDFEPDTMSLRVSGKILSGPEDVSLGSYHSFSIKKGDKITIKKHSITPYTYKKLREAEEPPTNVLVVLVEREEASFARLTKTGYDEITRITGSTEKKQYDEVVKNNFFSDVAKRIETYEERYDVSSIVLASPSFWKENVLKHVSETVKKKIILSKVSRIDSEGYNELLKQKEITEAIASENNKKESKVLTKLLKAIRNEEAAYGFRECQKASKIGAVEKVLVGDDFMKERYQKDEYKGVEILLKEVEKMNGEIYFIKEETNQKKIESLGGIAAILRWKQ